MLKRAEYLVILLFFTLTLGAAVSVGLIAKCSFKNNHLTFICDLLLITSYTISLLFLLYLVLHAPKSVRIHRQSIANGGDTDNQSASAIALNQQLTQQLATLLTSTNVRESNLAIYTFISILGVGDSIFNITRSIDQLFAIISVEHNHEHEEKLFLISSFIENFVKVFYQIFLLLFIIYHKDYEGLFCSKSWLKWFIGYLSILCLIQWIFIILQEIFQERGLYSLHVTTYRLHSMNLTSFHDYEPFLYPLGIEFRICCFIEILFIFLSSFSWHCNKYSINESDSRQVVTTRRLFKPFNKLLLVSSNYKNRSKSSIFFILMVFTVFLFSLSIIVMLFQYTNLETNTDVVLFLHELCELVVIMCLLVMFLRCGASCSSSISNTSVHDMDVILMKYHDHQRSVRNSMSSAQQRMPQQKKCELMKKIDFIFLYISFAFLSVECLLVIVGDLILFTNKSSSTTSVTIEVHALTLLTALLTILQAILQLSSMWNLTKKHNLNKKCLNMAILLNLILWLFDTFGDKKLAKNQVQIHSYGIEAWEQFSPIFLPLAIFFRFHSCMVLVKIKYEKYLMGT